jgi:thiosulfate/3-mercaptopyruvate sulfurtransferase
MKDGTHARSMTFAFVIPLTLALTLGALAQDLPSKLVDTGWLAANYGKLKIRIVDMRPDVRDYWLSHLPGAVYLSPETLRWPDKGVPVKLIPVPALVDLLGRMEIDPTTIVIVYSEKDGFMPLYFLWALDYIGHKYVGLLDGGFDKWKSEGRFLTQDYPVKIKPVVYPVPARIRNDLRATLQEVKDGLGKDTILVDTRALEAYNGEKGSWRRRGHIPGAVHHFWNTDLGPDESWRSLDDLRSDYASLGVTADKKIIVYCGSGQMSSHTYFVLKYLLGFPSVKNYDGGFGEWSNVPDLPVEKSKK